MQNLHISLLLHFYQPWWQFISERKKITAETYRPIIELLNSVDGFASTVNINLSLLEHLQDDAPDVIGGLKKVLESGKIELTGSTAHHPIVPLIPDWLKEQQILTDKQVKENRFGISRNCRGIFLPEMAFSRKDIPLMRRLEYKWTIIDDEPFNAIHRYIPFDKVTVYDGMKIFLRSAYWSNMISSGNLSFSELKARMEHEISEWTHGAPAYVIIAMDVETFGHHDRKRGADLLERLLKPMLKEWAGNKIVPIEMLGNIFPSSNIHYLPDCSWSTSGDDLARNDPYPLWDSRFSRYHYKLWELINVALNYYKDAPDECLKMTSSCHWWWISGRPYWEPEFMKKGAKKAIEVVRTFGSAEEKDEAEILYSELVSLY